MRDAGAPGRGRHASPDDGRGADPAAWDAGIPAWDGDGFRRVPEQRSWDAPTASWQPWDERTGRLPQAGSLPDERPYRAAGQADPAEWAPGGLRRASGLLERHPDPVGQTGPMPEWRHRSGGGDPPPRDPSSGRNTDASDAGRSGAYQDRGTSRHPSSPLPPMPPSVWAKLQPRADALDDEPTAVADSLPALDDPWAGDRWSDEEWSDDPGPRAPSAAADDDETQAHPVLDPHDSLDDAGAAHDDWDRTGGLDVIGEHVEAGRRRGWFHRSRQAPEDGRHLPPHDDGAAHLDDGHVDDGRYRDAHHGDADYDDAHHDDADYDDARYDAAYDDARYDAADPDGGHLDDGHLDDGDIPIAPYDPRPQRRRKRRKRAALVVCLVLLAGLIGGVVVGGQKLWGMFSAQDYTGPGTGSVRIRVQDGDTLTDIGQTMVDDGVIASVRPFVKAAEADPQATAIAPGVYGLRHHMSGKAALDLLLQPSSRLMSRVTVPEGMTVEQTLQRLSQGTGATVAELKAVAAKPAALGLPAYARGSLEGFLFPATYDFEPGTTPTQMLSTMVERAVQTLDELRIPEPQRLAVVTKASIVQAESGSAEDMPKIARVLDNRLAKGMKLQLDTTVNYANGKSGVTTSTRDRQNPSPYNTYLHAGLPPGPISNPGEQALRAVLAPAAGNWLYFVVVNPDTGETRFAATAEEHQKNVALFQKWLRAHPGG